MNTHGNKRTHAQPLKRHILSCGFCFHSLKLSTQQIDTEYIKYMSKIYVINVNNYPHDLNTESFLERLRNKQGRKMN